MENSVTGWAKNSQTLLSLARRGKRPAAVWLNRTNKFTREQMSAL
jgi:hypothetical protein